MSRRTAVIWMLWSLLALSATAHATTIEYIHTDALGSIVAVTDATGAVKERREWEPYGEQLTPAPSNGPGYTGHVQDASTGLVYMQQRYYDPVVGRFLSVDPVTADTVSGGNLNRYWYANNNPYRFTDLDGRMSGEPGERAFAASMGLFTPDEIYFPTLAAEAARPGGGVSGAMAGFRGIREAAITTAEGGDAKAAVAAAAGMAVVKKAFKPGAKFTQAQKRDILAANRERNGGELRSDKSGNALVPSEKSMSGVTPSPQEAQVDHKIPRSAGGTNDPGNAQVLSRKENRDKSNK